MSRFRFGNSIVKIEIEDMIFRVEISPEFRAKMIESSKKMKEVREKCASMSEAEKESAVIPVFDKAIDEILGKGSSEKIFAGRKPDSYERIAVYIFICDEINKQCCMIKAAENEISV